jgi:hypothetical protein
LSESAAISNLLELARKSLKNWHLRIVKSNPAQVSTCPAKIDLSESKLITFTQENPKKSDNLGGAALGYQPSTNFPFYEVGSGHALRLQPRSMSNAVELPP